MRDIESFNKRSGESMSSIVAIEAQELVRDVANPVQPGEKIKAQINRAYDRLRKVGYRDKRWRVRAAWHGEAGCWSAAALEELRGKYAAWKERQSKSAETELAKLGSLYAALAERLEAMDAEFHNQTIEQLVSMARKLGPSPDKEG